MRNMYDPIVTVDLDSTLADTTHRSHMVDRTNGTDWAAYAKACALDTPIAATVTLVRMLALVADIHYVTGRPEAARSEAEAWLRQHKLPRAGLWMDGETGQVDYTSRHHAEYKLWQVRQVETVTGCKVVLHVDDWIDVKLLLEQHGYPVLCVRSPYDIADFLAGKKPPWEGLSA